MLFYVQLKRSVHSCLLTIYILTYMWLCTKIKRVHTNTGMPGIIVANTADIDVGGQ